MTSSSATTDKWRGFPSRELELLTAIAEGRNAFERRYDADIQDLDACLQIFAELGYVERVVRSQSASEARPRRIDVIGGLTAIGEKRRRELLAESAKKTSRPGADAL